MAIKAWLTCQIITILALLGLIPGGVGCVAIP